MSDNRGILGNIGNINNLKFGNSLTKNIGINYQEKAKLQTSSSLKSTDFD